MISVVKGMCLQGLEGVLINVEVDISPGMPCWDVVGLPDTNIRESKERVRTSIKNCGIELSSRRYIINLSPATIRKDGAVLDLAIAVGVLISMEIVKTNNLDTTIFVGELSLNGKLNRVNGILPICIEAAKNGIKRVILPKENTKEAAIVNNIEVIGVDNLNQVIEYLNGRLEVTPEKLDEGDLGLDVLNDLLDYSEVKGHETIKRALEVAAAGGHNCLMIGSPGTGKTMLAKRLPTILPDLSFEEALEITKIHSIAGILNKGNLISKRPFRSPHHTITENGLIGGGRIPRPGEISLAHLGVLFLDELLEFNKNTLEVLRGPLEDRVVNISRVGINITYPCNFMLIASMNPCPCGYYGSKIKECTCTERQRILYRSRLSGPMLDRFDIHIKVPQIDYKKMSDRKGKASCEIKERVNNARKLQQKRYKELSIYSNSELTPGLIEKYCVLTKSTREILNNSIEKLNLSTRAYSKILKVSRTIADLDGRENIETEDVLEAIQYRSLDKI
ncbi:MAG: YifB family Mg chelatase-like AAA ATPase [Clostridia bacterium]|nr:YifB family Mg chelatase-like AAA ATPase [Clostridia bacterium]